MDVPDAAELAVEYPLPRLVQDRVEADVVVRAVDEARLLGQPEQLRRLRGGERQRLLADDVLSGSEDGLDLRVVEVVGRRQVHDPHAVVVQHRLEALVRLGKPGLLPRALGRGADDPDHVDADAAQSLDMDDADESGPDDGGPDHAPTLTGLREDDPVEGKVAVVTGSAGGIGGAVAAAFADAGAEVIGLDREQADLTRPDEVESFFAGLERLDVLFNGAGISGRSLGDGPVDECTVEGWNAVLANNLTSVFLCSKHAIPLLRRAGGGAIVNLSSAMALTAGDDDFATHAYQVSKAGILTLTRAMAFHYGRDGIRVNAIAPGLIATPMSLRAQSDPRIVARLPELHPLTGDFGRPEDVAGAALYLATAPFVTGAVLSVDGGWTLR